jgi:hypothetical protein
VLMCYNVFRTIRQGSTELEGGLSPAVA